MSIIESLKWRYATKKYHSEKRVSEADMLKIVEAARLAPSSSGLQQFRVFAISDQKVKEKMVDIAWGQQIVSEASYILVFASWDKYTDDRVDSAFDRMNTERNLPLNTTDAYKTNLKEQLSNLSQDQQAAHTAKQAYIALGIAIAQAAELNVDSTPMEGFNGEELDIFLGLDRLGLKSSVMLALGYRHEEGDWLVNLKKFRIPTEEFLTVV